MKRILLAGSTGYLGKYVLSELIQQGYDVVLLVRDKNKLPATLDQTSVRIHEGDLTQPHTLRGCCEGVDAVLSTVGVNKQRGKGGGTPAFDANHHLLLEAKRERVHKFIFVSTLVHPDRKQSPTVKAKEAFVKTLIASGMHYSIIRPNGFFSDMGFFYRGAKKGKIVLFGDGHHQINPIGGYDLAVQCVQRLKDEVLELEIGGPEILSYKECAELAFRTLGKEPNIKFVPDRLVQRFFSIANYTIPKNILDRVKFIYTVLTRDSVAPLFGTETLAMYFEQLYKEEKEGRGRETSS